MASKQGFSLIEVIAALVIVGIAIIFIVPNIIISSEQTKAQAARNNLLAIVAAQQRYFEDNGSYCVADNTAALNSCLRLSSSSSDPFSYSCSGPSSYTCTATDGTDTWRVTPGASPICTPSGGNCPS